MPAMKAMRSSRNRGGCFASKLCSHNPTGINPLATMVFYSQKNKGLIQEAFILASCLSTLRPHPLGQAEHEQQQIIVRLDSLAGLCHAR
ncbi:hypothetical protein B1219_19875 [Pseudomonas ogarae]|nr:hypothetical protein B1219_19875 [Pseudomonas ogarae]